MHFFNVTFWDRREDHWLSLPTLWTHCNPETVLSFHSWPGHLITSSLGSVFENWASSEPGWQNTLWRNLVSRILLIHSWLLLLWWSSSVPTGKVIWLPRPPACSSHGWHQFSQAEWLENRLWDSCVHKSHLGIALTIPVEDKSSDWPTRSPWDSLLHPSHLGLQKQDATFDFMWLLGTWIWVLGFTSQALYPLTISLAVWLASLPSW